MKIISVGDLVTDFYYKNGKLVGVNGGMTSHNIIANITKLGFECSVYGVCGNDCAGNIALLSLKDIGVDTSNINVINDLNTRCFHVSYSDDLGNLVFQSKKRCPICGGKKWYDESRIDPAEILKKISEDDILVFDNLNSKNQVIIDKCDNRKMLDLGQYFELDNYNNEEIVKKIQNKFDLINLNERVEKYLKNRFCLKSLEDIYNLLQPNMIIVTRGTKGTDFVFDNKIVSKKLENPAKEVDSTGAGDAFFSMFISEYIKNNYLINNDFIDSTFERATKLTKKVVMKFGARGHIQNLYKIKKYKDNCTCNEFEIVKRKQIKRCNINVNNLEKRIINAVNSNAYDKLLKINFESINNAVFVGSGGSFAGAKFSSKVINNLYGINTSSIYPRDIYYRNNKKIELVFLFSYSGTTNDLLISTHLIDNKNKYIITKGELQTVVTKTGISKSNIISYRTGTNKGKERGFLSFEGALAPASIFLKLYFEKNKKDNIMDFIKESVNYWKSYFDKYFNKNKKVLKSFLNPGSMFNIFTGDFTESACSDLESKIVESGIYNCIIHEKKNFSHGRFINYEHLSQNKNIYFKQKNSSLYEEQLLKYLSNDNNLIIESQYDGILCEYDLLISSQYLIYYISNFLDIDISKPTYSENAMKIYFYKGEL
ncbi:MAG: PfkB family carbohydrate kinase [bacterium]|nr:PfkB family carbohydrate kinase [bacterium]